jgi:MFS family permease
MACECSPHARASYSAPPLTLSDTGSFGSLQAIPAFLRQFGEEQANGTFALSTSRRSIMNSVVFIGKGLGCLVFEPIVSWIGYKKLMFIIMALQIVGVVGESFGVGT